MRRPVAASRCCRRNLTNRADLAHVEGRLAGDATITTLVNNAGVSLKGGLLENGSDVLEKLIALNITAPTVLAAAAAKSFAQRKAGAIINISSVLALAPEALEGVYSGSKAYLLNLSLKLALDVKAAGVRVQAVLPGATRTEIWARSGKDVDAILPGKVMEVDDLVDAALVGFDRGELVTIPPLADEGLWTAYNEARLRARSASIAPRGRGSLPREGGGVMGSSDSLMWQNSLV